MKGDNPESVAGFGQTERISVHRGQGSFSMLRSMNSERDGVSLDTCFLTSRINGFSKPLLKMTPSQTIII